MLRAEVAPSVQERMLPRRPRGSVSLVYAIEEPGYWAWGFAAPSAQGDPGEVAERPQLWRPFDDGASAPDLPIGVTWQTVWPLVEAPDLFAAEHFLKRLREVVRKGGLDEGSEILLRETIRAAVGRNTQQLGVRAPPRWNHHVRDLGLDIGEIDIESTRRAVHATWAAREARYQGSYPPMDPRTQEAAVAARGRALSGERFRKPNVTPRDAYGRLDEALHALQEIGETFVSSELPAPDVSLATPTESLAEAYSTNSLADLIVAVRSRFASEWPTFIALNFGQLGRLESFLKAAPAAEAIQYEPQRNQFIDSFTARYALIPGRFRILVGIADVNPVIVHDQDQHWPFVRVDGTLVRADSWGICDLNTLLGWEYHLPLGWEGPQGYFTPIRALLYGRVRAALEKTDAAALVRLLQAVAK